MGLQLSSDYSILEQIWILGCIVDREHLWKNVSLANTFSITFQVAITNTITNSTHVRERSSATISIASASSPPPEIPSGGASRGLQRL